jgi:flagellar biosynthesis/type III secretory pathway M-ring protein FliF/YscJ
MSSAVAHQKKAVNYWNYIIAGGVVALVLFFIILGCVIAKLIPKEVELTDEEKLAKEEADVATTHVDEEDPAD